MPLISKPLITFPNFGEIFKMRWITILIKIFIHLKKKILWRTRVSFCIFAYIQIKNKFWVIAVHQMFFYPSLPPSNIQLTLRFFNHFERMKAKSFGFLSQTSPPAWTTQCKLTFWRTPYLFFQGFTYIFLRTIEWCQHSRKLKAVGKW